MPDWFYYDQQGQKIGPITDSELREHIDQGLILPDTKLETDTGHSGKARQVPCLFAEVSQSEPAGTQKAEAYCTNCGHPVVCPGCGGHPFASNKFCRVCGIPMNPEQVICVRCGAPVHPGQAFYGIGREWEEIPDYLVWAVLETLFCCLPFGAIAIVYAVGANSEKSNGNYALARKKARSAERWLICGFVFGLIAFVLGVFATGLGNIVGNIDAF